MNRWLRSTVLTVMFALLTMSVAQAQDTVTVTGKVTTAADGLALPGATVTIPALKLTAETGEDGTTRSPCPPAMRRDRPSKSSVIYSGLQTAIGQRRAVGSRTGRARFRARVRLPRRDHRRLARGRRRGGEGGAGRHPHAAADRDRGRERDQPDHPGARAVVQLPAADDHRRHRHRAPGDPARPRARPGAGAGQRQAPAHQRAGARQRHHRPRLDRRRPQRHPGLGDRAHRDPARRRRRAVRLGRHRRRDQHRAQVRASAARRSTVEGRHDHRTATAS